MNINFYQCLPGYIWSPDYIKVFNILITQGYNIKFNSKGLIVNEGLEGWFIPFWNQVTKCIQENIELIFSIMNGVLGQPWNIMEKGQCSSL